MNVHDYQAFRIKLLEMKRLGDKKIFEEHQSYDRAERQNGLIIYFINIHDTHITI